MSAINSEVLNTVNKVIETCLDGQHGFDAAAYAISDANLKEELASLSRQRRAFASELQVVVASMGEKPTDSGTLAGAVHRGWMNFKEALTKDNRHAILAECERGEDAAVKTYRQALDNSLPETIRPIIESQFREVLHSHDQIKSLRDETQAD